MVVPPTPSSSGPSNSGSSISSSASRSAARDRTPGHLVAELTQLLGDTYLAHLRRFADRNGLAAHEVSISLAVGVALTGPATHDHVELSITPVRHRDELARIVAPDRWDMFGIVAIGTDARNRDRPIDLVHLQHRAGPSATLLDDRSGRPVVQTDSWGATADLCRSVLGMAPTPPAGWA